MKNLNELKKETIKKLEKIKNNLSYGNLENVNINDFEFCIDEAITKLKESLEA